MDYRLEELLIVTIARMLDGLGHVAVGASSPIPGAAAFLARHRSGAAMRVSILGSEKHNPFTDGGRELFDCAAQGRIDAFFLGGAQIDGQANINLVGVGGYPNSQVRFQGSFGSAYLYYLVPRVILFSMQHTRRIMVPEVEFISAPGVSDDDLYRPGGPYALLSGRCRFDFDRERRRFTLTSLHPGETLESVRDNTGFDFNVSDRLETTRAPDEDELALIRGPIGEAIGETYPAFARMLLDEASATA